MASQELRNRQTCDSTLQMRPFFPHKFQTLVIHKASYWGYDMQVLPAGECKRQRNLHDIEAYDLWYVYDFILGKKYL